MVQQPIRGAAVGMSLNTLGRVPVVPAPVVELVELGEPGPDGSALATTPDMADVRHLVCSCAVVVADVRGPETGPSSRLAGVAGGQDGRGATLDYVYRADYYGQQRLQMLVGQLMASVRLVDDLDGRAAAYFGASAGLNASFCGQSGGGQSLATSASGMPARTTCALRRSRRT
jgi:hypothetical protein